jgi:hypothetical protein
MERITKSHIISRAPKAAKVPAAKSSESPGRKGVTTRPVSRKIMVNIIR